MSATESMNETYDDVKNLVHATAYQFMSKFGGDADTVISEAYDYYMGAYRLWDPNRNMSFPTFVRRCIWLGLLESLRKKIRRGNKVTLSDMTEDLYADKDQFNLVDFLDGLTEDAKTVVNLILDTPRSIAVLFEDKKPAAIKNLLKDYLFALGWGVERVEETFSEIQENLE